MHAINGAFFFTQLYPEARVTASGFQGGLTMNENKQGLTSSQKRKLRENLIG